jgi:HTH-type transcriptional regulator, competence development regulator
MKIEIDKDWCLRMAALEGDAEIGAGSHAVDPVFDGNVVDSVLFDETAGAFGRFVRLMRRDKELTVEKLAGVSDYFRVARDAIFRPLSQLRIFQDVEL